MRIGSKHRMAKPANKTRLVRYPIDRFLLDQSRNVNRGALLLNGGAGSCKHGSFFPQAHIFSFDNRQQRRRRYGEIDLVGSLYELPFKDDTFEAALNVEVLEHVSEPEKVLAELFRVLRPGGKLFLIAPQGYEEHQIPHDYFRFTSFGLRFLLEKTGYQILSMDPLGGFFWYLGHMISESYRYFFPDDRKRAWKILDAPLRLPARLLLRKLIPYLCFYLDRLDTRRTWTLNYASVSVKPFSHRNEQ
jgi:SAM-dependent methyltransferase